MSIPNLRFFFAKMKRKTIIKMCKAIGREIRYVEYKLRRQQQEKKKKKQSRQDWLNGANSGGMSVRDH